MLKQILKVRLKSQFPQLSCIRTYPSHVNRTLTENVQDRHLKFNGFLPYFIENEQYKIFRKTSEVLYEFSSEPRSVVQWEHIKPKRIIQWNHLPADCSNEDVIVAFDDFLNYSIEINRPLSDEMFDDFVDIVACRLQTLSSNQLIKLLQIFALKGSLTNEKIRQRNYIELFMAFDNACTVKANDMIPEELLFMSSVWLTIPYAKKSFYTVLVCRLFNRYARNMNAKQLSQAIFYINCMNRPIDDIRAFENIITNVVMEVSPQELSMLLWTFYRLETKVEKPQLKAKIFEYIENNNLSDLNDEFLTRILMVKY